MSNVAQSVNILTEEFHQIPPDSCLDSTLN